MALYIATTQNTMMVVKKEYSQKVLSDQKVQDLAKKHNLFIESINLDDYSGSAIGISAFKSDYNSFYDGDIFEFKMPQTICNELLEEKSIAFLDDLFLLHPIDGSEYELTKAGVYNIVIS